MRKIDRVKQQKVFENNFGSLYNDDVRNYADVPGKYLRWQWGHSGVVVVPQHKQAFALTEMFRYPIGQSSLEFPRGGIQESESPENAAIREMEEELGLVATETKLLGHIFADTGLIENSVAVVLAAVNDQEQISDRSNYERRESFEAIDSIIQWKNLEEVNLLISRGRLTCSLTIAALHMASVAK